MAISLQSTARVKPRGLRQRVENPDCVIEHSSTQQHSAVSVLDISPLLANEPGFDFTYRWNEENSNETTTSNLFHRSTFIKSMTGLG